MEVESVFLQAQIRFAIAYFSWKAAYFYKNVGTQHRFIFRNMLTAESYTVSTRIVRARKLLMTF